MVREDLNFSLGRVWIRPHPRLAGVRCVRTKCSAEEGWVLGCFPLHLTRNKQKHFKIGLRLALLNMKRLQAPWMGFEIGRAWYCSVQLTADLASSSWGCILSMWCHCVCCRVCYRGVYHAPPTKYIEVCQNRIIFLLSLAGLMLLELWFSNSWFPHPSTCVILLCWETQQCPPGLWWCRRNWWCGAPPPILLEAKYPDLTRLVRNCRKEKKLKLGLLESFCC